ncbi:Hypothetical Protein FCC1311_111892, partial [Hondaea fermentalgiana]
KTRADAVAFLEFATASEVAGLLMCDLQQPRSLVVPFYEEGLSTKRMCSVLQDVDLQAIGATSSLQRRMFSNESSLNAAQVPQKSLPKRVSRQLRLREYLTNRIQDAGIRANVQAKLRPLLTPDIVGENFRFD